MVGGPLPAEGKPRSDPKAVRLPGEAADPARLRVAPTLSSADARDDEPVVYDGATPVSAGDEACEAPVEAEFALGEESKEWDGSIVSRVAIRGSMPYTAAWAARSERAPGEPV